LDYFNIHDSTYKRDLEDLSKLFSRKDLRDSFFQDTIIIILYPRKGFQ
jgi:hypothetical protein